MTASPATGRTVTHTYAAPGTYAASLTVTRGAATDTDPVTVRVKEAQTAPGLVVTVEDAAARH